MKMKYNMVSKRKSIIILTGVFIICLLCIRYWNFHYSTIANKYPYLTESRRIEFEEHISADGNSIEIGYYLWYDGTIIQSNTGAEWVKIDNLRSREEEYKIWANDLIMMYSHLEHEP